MKTIFTPSSSLLAIATAVMALAAMPSAAVAELAQIDLSGLSASAVIAGANAAGNPAAYNNRGPVYAFNGAGLDANGCHGTAANGEMFMLSSNNSGSFPWYIQVDLGEVKRLDAVRLYNFNFAASGKEYTVRGVRNFKLFVSTSATWSTSAGTIQSSYRLALSGTLPKAPGTNGYEGTYFELDAPVNARYVALVALDDYDDSVANLNYNGISEIQLFSGGEPLEEVVDTSAPIIVDNSDETGVEISGAWTASAYNAERYGANYLHNGRMGSEDMWVRFTPTLPTNAAYKVSLFWNGDDTRSSVVPVEIVHADGVTTNYVDMTVHSDTWNTIGAWRFSAGSSGSVRIMTAGIEGDYAIADAVKFEILPPVLIVIVR